MKISSLMWSQLFIGMACHSIVSVLIREPWSDQPILATLFSLYLVFAPFVIQRNLRLAKNLTNQKPLSSASDIKLQKIQKIVFLESIYRGNPVEDIRKILNEEEE